MNPILRVINITKFFGGLTALLNINIEAREGQIVGIIGPNGAGKTTLFNCLTGLYYPTEGQIFFQDLPIVPQLSTLKKKFVHRMAVSFLILGLLWVPLLVAFFLPRTYFKVELVLLAIFVMVIRYLVIHGLKQFQIWAWSVTFVFLLADMFLAVWWLGHPSSLGLFLNSSIPLAYFAFPWSLFMIAFGMFFFWQLLLREVRQLFGFRVGPDAICKYGISRTFQNIRLFLSLSVLDNVKIGSHVRLNSGLWTTLFKAPSQRQEEQTIEQKTLEILRFVGLEHRAFDLAGALPYGEQRRLEIARALASNPKLLLLDEPAAGMNPQESMRLIRLIRKIRDTGVTVLIIEHDMKVMMNLADEIYALDHGELIAHGVPDEIRTNPKVIEAYLGGSLAYAEA